MGVPRTVQRQIRAVAFNRADQCDYMRQDRATNSNFILQLVNDAGIGGRLAAYMPRERVKTYIKDTLLNAYSKERFMAALGPDPLVSVRDYCQGKDVCEVESHPGRLLWLFRVSDGSEVLVAGGTLVKWETALRKALEFLAASPGYRDGSRSPIILLRLVDGGRPMSSSDRMHLERTLSLIGVHAIVAGEQSPRS